MALCFYIYKKKQHLSLAHRLGFKACESVRYSYCPATDGWPQSVSLWHLLCDRTLHSKELNDTSTHTHAHTILYWIFFWLFFPIAQHHLVYCCPWTESESGRYRRGMGIHIQWAKSGCNMSRLCHKTDTYRNISF